MYVGFTVGVVVGTMEGDAVGRNVPSSRHVGVKVGALLGIPEGTAVGAYVRVPL